jgi:hypothetical protein
LVVVPTEGQQLLDQFTGFFTRRDDLSDMTMGLGLSRDQWEGQFAEAEYSRKAIIQLMCDATGKSTDRFNPRRLAPPGVHVLTISYIDDRPECAHRLPQRTIAIKRSHGTKTDMAHSAIGSDKTVLDLIPAIACGITGWLDRRGYPNPIVNVNQFEIALP